MEAVAAVSWTANELINEMLDLDPDRRPETCRILREPLDMLLVAALEGMAGGLRSENLESVATCIEGAIWLEAGLESWSVHPWREDIARHLGTRISDIALYLEVLAKAVESVLLVNQGDGSNSEYFFNVLTALDELRNFVEEQTATQLQGEADPRDGQLDGDANAARDGSSALLAPGRGSVLLFPYWRETDPFS